MPLEIVISKNDKKTHFVSTARTSVTRHVTLNVPNSPNPKKSLSISKYMISNLKAHYHPPINDRSIANASCTAIGPPPLKSRPSLQTQVSKTKKIRVPDRG
ncbi:hypothetical protein TNCV_2599121 [Trichonephila clavipes]|nr:hypothetical protein TNCV_2599121 [Trichonephila clavipes]